ncbi:MAG: helix-turn-helix domain-containing protein [Gammaproteobacteria bacterium]
MPLKDLDVHRMDSGPLPLFAGKESDSGRSAAEGACQKILTSTLAASFERPSGRQLVVALTRREHQILDLLATGRSTKEIATQVFLSKDTVKYHLKNIYGKLCVRNRTAALMAAGENGLLQGRLSQPLFSSASQEGHE